MAEQMDRWIDGEVDRQVDGWDRVSLCVPTWV